jgi:hypothetical protein
MRSCKNSRMRLNGKFPRMLLLTLAITFPSISQAAGDTVVPEGTRITLQLNDYLSTKRSKEGDAFKAIVVSPIYQGERIAIPKGSVVSGNISRILRPGRFKGKPRMTLLFQSINITGRGEHPISAMLEKVINSDDNTETTTEGTVKGKGSENSDITRVVLPSLVGSGIGGLAGGAKGAGIGAGVGAGVGLINIISTRGKDLELSRGSTLEIALEKPLVVPANSSDISAKNH